MSKQRETSWEEVIVKSPQIDEKLFSKCSSYQLDEHLKYQQGYGAFRAVSPFSRLIVFAWNADSLIKYSNPGPQDNTQLNAKNKEN